MSGVPRKLSEPETSVRYFNLYLGSLCNIELVNIRVQDKWRMLIFDGFESYIQMNWIEYSLDHEIHSFCLPVHTSHVCQPLDIGIFSSLSTKYKQEVNLLLVPVDKPGFQIYWQDLPKKHSPRRILQLDLELLESGNWIRSLSFKMLLFQSLKLQFILC